MINHSYIKTTNNQINFIVHIIDYFRYTFISEENLQLLPIDDSIFNHINSFRIFINCEAIEENLIPQLLMYRQKADTIDADTIDVNQKLINRNSWYESFVWL